DFHAVLVVAEAFGACGVSADPIALHQVVRRPRVRDEDAVRTVPGDDVTSASSRPADRVQRGSSDDQYPEAVAECGGAGGVEADEVALDQVARRPRAADEDAVRTVAGDDFAGVGGCPADRVRRGSSADSHDAPDA